MRATADVSAMEQQIITEALRRVAILRPFLAMLLAEALAGEDAELAALVSQVDVASAELPAACWPA